MLNSRAARSITTAIHPVRSPWCNNIRHHLRHASSSSKPTSQPKPSTTLEETPRQRTLRYLLKPFAAPPLLSRFPTLYWLNKILIWFAAGSLALHIFFEYGFTMTQAYGISMMPTMASSGEWLIISKYYRRGRGISIGDVVSFRAPVRIGERAVKRVLGMPGDFVLRDTPGSEGKGIMIQVPTGHCWVVGDNLTWSRDSRMFGPLPLALVTGKVVASGRSLMGFGFVENKLKVPPEEEDDDD